jgi:hypothetical protein
MLGKRGEIFGSGLEGDFIRGPCEVPKRELVVGVFGVEKAFEVSEVLRTVEEGVS